MSFTCQFLAPCAIRNSSTSTSAGFSTQHRLRRICGLIIISAGVRVSSAIEVIMRRTLCSRSYRSGCLCCQSRIERGAFTMSFSSGAGAGILGHWEGRSAMARSMASFQTLGLTARWIGA